MPDLSRQQLIAWSLVAIVILLMGAYYLRGQLSRTAPEANPVVTMGIKEERISSIKVHVAGAVVNPGLYELEGGARIADALQRAGGPVPEADLSQINLAAKLADGQQVAVPIKGAASASAAPGAASSGPAVSGGPGQPLNLNTATADQLEKLDGVGPKTAQKIVEYRESKGGFQSVDELMEVPGIGPAKFDQIKSQVCV